MNVKRYVGVVVKNGNRFLICKRNDVELGQGEWSIPAGKVEDNENLENSAKREFFEETASNINDYELSFAGMIPRNTRDGGKMKGLMYVYKIETENPINVDLEEAIDGHEHTAWGYYTLEEMKNMKISVFLYKLFEFMSKDLTFA
jgi:ADP-ribose pyrophosphatase YjhB (NUDIX family)